MIEEICDWNIERDNIVYDKRLEINMLVEELQEYIDSTTMVDDADALADIIFVAVGSLFKLSGSYQKVEDIMLLVTAANNLKGKVKNEDGKIIKDMVFTGPERAIAEILGSSL